MLAASKDFHILNPNQLMVEIRLGLYSSVESLLNSLKNNVWADCHSYPKLSNLKQWNVHTVGSDTIFVQIYMDPPPEAPGVSKDAPGSTKHAI